MPRKKKRFSAAGQLPAGWRLLETKQTGPGCWIAFCYERGTDNYGIVAFFGNGIKHPAGPIVFSPEYESTITPALERFITGDYDAILARRKARAAARKSERKAAAEVAAGRRRPKSAAQRAKEKVESDARSAARKRASSRADEIRKTIRSVKLPRFDYKDDT